MKTSNVLRQQPPLMNADGFAGKQCRTAISADTLPSAPQPLPPILTSASQNDPAPTVAGQQPQANRDQPTDGDNVSWLMGKLRLWRQRAARRRALRRALRWHFNERLMRDIGVDPITVRWEAGKPLWRE